MSSRWLETQKIYAALHNAIIAHGWNLDTELSSELISVYVPGDNSFINENVDREECQVRIVHTFGDDNENLGMARKQADIFIEATRDNVDSFVNKYISNNTISY